MSLTILNNQRERLKIPEPLWTFPLVASLVRDPNEQNKKYKPGVYVEETADETHHYAIQVTLEKESITDIALENRTQFDDETNAHFLDTPIVKLS